LKRTGLNIEDFFNLPGAELFNPDNLNRISAVSADSRNMPPDALFIAIEGSNFDGHNFIEDAVNNGAAAIMINRKRSDIIEKINIPVIVVDDTLKGLGDVASVWRKKLETKIIAITGSAGKTTTKEMLSFVLGQKFKVNRTTANNNNHIGVPLTILSTNQNHEILIAELGTNHFGEIEYTASIAAPDYALITNIGHSHLEYLKDKKGVLKEKGILFDITSDRKGFIFVNSDDPLLKKYTDKFSSKLTYGFKGDPDVKGEITGYTDEGNPEVEVKFKNKKLKAVVPSPGQQSAFNFLAVCAVAFKLGLKKDEIISGIAAFSNIKGRMNVKKLKDFTLLDDCYNANPDSMKYSISLLSNFRNKNKVAILGDMFELGEGAADHHKQLAKIIRKSKIDEVYTIGGLMKNLFDELNNMKIKARHFIDRQTLKDVLEEKDFSDSVVLIKGSRGMKMEEFAEIVEARNK
jgi:UDP-N-acetylmuramoyl-tripeptide--D-alanyl-D-alanine ligase